MTSAALFFSMGGSLGWIHANRASTAGRAPLPPWSPLRPAPCSAPRRPLAGPAALAAGLLGLWLGLLPAARGAAAWELGLGRSSRPGNVDLSLRGRGWQIEYVDEGRQPDGIPNRNRVLDLDGVLATRGRLSGFVEAGLSSSRPSRNGSGNGYRASGPMLGLNAGAGLQWRFAPGWRLRLQSLWMRYPQCSAPGMEDFVYTSVALVRAW